MKTKFLKTFSLITTILIVSVAFISCTKLQAQKSLSQTVWGEEETFKYIAQYNKDDQKINGTLTLSIKRINKNTVNIGSIELKNFIGTVFDYDLLMENGSSIKIISSVNAQNQPVASFIQKDDKLYNIKEDVLINYVEKEKVAIITKNNTAPTEIKTGKFEKNLYLENASIYSILRAIDNPAITGGFAFKSVNSTEKTLTPLFAKVIRVDEKQPIKTTKEIDAQYKDTNVIAVATIALQQKNPPPGEPILLYIGKSIKLDDKTINNPILQIKEGSMTYILDTVS